MYYPIKPEEQRRKVLGGDGAFHMDRLPYTRNYSNLPVIETSDTKYAGQDGEHILGWTIQGDRIVLHTNVISGVAYWERRDPRDVKTETFVHERGHNKNPYASEEANRVAVVEEMLANGKQPTSLHLRYL